MIDAKRYKAALVSQYSDVVLAIDHDAAIAAKDARIAELELEREGDQRAKKELAKLLGCEEPRWSSMILAATPSEDGVEATEFRDVTVTSIDDAYHDDIGRTEAVNRIVAQHSRIVAAKDAEIAKWKSHAGLLREDLARLRAQPARQVGDWPKLDKPAKVGCVRFRAGVSAQLVVEAAQRQYEYDVTPEKEAERIAKAADFLGILHGALQDCGDERDAFEAGINPHCRRRNEHGDYVVPEIQDRWDGWQARAALAPAAVVMPGTTDLDGVLAEAEGVRDASDVVHGWCEATERFARLNRRAIPVGLIEASRRAADILGSQGFAAWDQLAAELRALLSQQQEGGV